MRLCTLLPLIILAACGLPDDMSPDASSSSASSTSEASSSSSDSSSSSSSGEIDEGDARDTTGDAGSTSEGSEGSGGWGEGQSTGELPTSCFADPCDDGECGSGLNCLPHPTSGEHMCVTPCGPPFACNEVSAAMCDDPGPVACLAVGAIKGCFPV